MNSLAQNSDFIIAVTAILALLSSAYSVFRNELNSKHQRQHNRLSVKPIGQITVGDWQEHLFVGIENAGSGPLIITKLNVYRDDALQDEHLIELMPELPPQLFWKNFVREGVEGRAILPGKMIKLVELAVDDQIAQQGEFRDLVRKALAQYEIRLEYENIYGEKIREVQRHLTWFVRHWVGTNNEVKR